VVLMGWRSRLAASKKSGGKEENEGKAILSRLLEPSEPITSPIIIFTTNNI
jgi:hypothetical protein